MANPAILCTFLSEEQRRTVEQAIGVLEQFRNSPTALTTPHAGHPSTNSATCDTSDMDAARTPSSAPQLRPTNSIYNSRLPEVLDSDGPSSSGLQSGLTLTQTRPRQNQG